MLTSVSTATSKACKSLWEGQAIILEFETKAAESDIQVTFNLNYNTKRHYLARPIMSALLDLERKGKRKAMKMFYNLIKLQSYNQ